MREEVVEECGIVATAGFEEELFRGCAVVGHCCCLDGEKVADARRCFLSWSVDGGRGCVKRICRQGGMSSCKRSEYG